MNRYIKEVGVGAAVFNIKDKAAIHTEEIDVTNNGAVGMLLNGAMTPIYDDEAIHVFKSATNARSIYIDAVNGNDDNDGTTAGSAIKTTDKALELLNTGLSYPYIFLVGNAVYEFKVNCLNFSGLHINSYMGNPTLKLVGDTGNPRFYGGHVNIARGTGSDYIILDAVTPGGLHAIYFEGTAVSMGHVKALCSVSVVGGSANIHDCDFTDRSNGVNTRISGRCTNMRVYDCSFYVEENGAAINLDRGCVLSAFYTGTYTNMKFSGAGLSIKAHTSLVFVPGAFSFTEYTNERYFDFNNCVVLLANNSAWRSINFSSANSLVSLGNNQTWITSLNIGSDETIANQYRTLYLTQGGLGRMYIKFNHKLNSNVSNISITASGTATILSGGSQIASAAINDIFEIGISSYDSFGANLTLTPKSAYASRFAAIGGEICTFFGVSFTVAAE